MKRATVADLRNQFRRVSAWIEEGETVQIIRRGKPFARLLAVAPEIQSKKKPDMLAQLREIWGDKMYTDAQVREMRETEIEREEG